MKAWILEQQAQVESKPLSLVEITAPHPQEDEVRLKIICCGICRTDIHIIEGDLPLKKSPVILGHEIVGIVDEVGTNVKRFQVGDRAGAYWLHDACGECKYCRSYRENYCPELNCTGWDVDGGYAEYITVAQESALPLNDIQLSASEIAPLMCPGIAGYAAFKLAEVEKGDKLGLYGFGPTAHCVLKIAQSLGIATYVSTRATKNIESARKEGANWVGDTSKEKMPCTLDSAIIFPPAGNLVEPALAQLSPGGTLVLAPVSASPIAIANYSDNLWGRSIKTLYNLKRSDAEEFFQIVDRLDLRNGTSLFPFEKLPEVLILAKQGKLDQPNAVLEIAD